MPDLIEAPYEVVELRQGAGGDAAPLRPYKRYPNGAQVPMTPDEVAVWRYVAGLRANQSTACKIAVLYYPPGSTETPAGPRANSAIAAEIVGVLSQPGAAANPEKVLAVILERIPAENAGQWTWVPPQPVDEVVVREAVLEPAAAAGSFDPPAAAASPRKRGGK